MPSILQLRRTPSKIVDNNWINKPRSDNKNPNISVIQLISLESGYISINELKAARAAAKKVLGNSGEIRLMIETNIPRTKIQPETTLGRGKGNVYTHLAHVQTTTSLLEVWVSTRFLIVGIKALTAARRKIGLFTTIV